jgi:hypothetical protein
MSRGHGETVIPFNNESDRINPAAIEFTWKDAGGITRNYTPRISSTGISMPNSEEDLPDFFFFAANQTISSLENASRFSEMSKAGDTSEFISLFRREYPWIKDLSIEVLGGVPVVHATTELTTRKIPLNDISGGINRLFGILLSMASRPKSVVIVDEIENGIFHGHYVPFWRALMDFAVRYDSQLFLSTHSQEWIEAMLEVNEHQLDSLQYWRLERDKNSTPIVRRFSGEELSLAASAGSEVR